MRIGGKRISLFCALPCFTIHARYAWCLTYFMNTHRDVYIVLKKSLKWVPIVGWVSETLWIDAVAGILA